MIEFPKNFPDIKRAADILVGLLVLSNEVQRADLFERRFLLNEIQQGIQFNRDFIEALSEGIMFREDEDGEPG